MTFLSCGINFLHLHSGVGGFWRISVHKWKLQSHAGALSWKLFIEAFAAAIVLEPMAQQSRLLEPVAREAVYGMQYADWVARNQTEADAAKQAEFAVAFRGNVGEGKKG